MVLDSMQRLVTDSLYERSLRTESHFVFNVSGETLFSQGPDILPAIETVLSEDVLPAFVGGRDSEHGFGGLTYVLGAYLVVGMKSEPTRVLTFVRSLPVGMLTRTLGIVPLFFGKPRGERSLVVEPTQEVIEFLIEMKTCGHKQVESAATRSFEMLQCEELDSK